MPAIVQDSVPAIQFAALPVTLSSKRSAIAWLPSGDDMSPVAGLLTIQTDRVSVQYRVTEFPTDWQGRGFHLMKTDDGSDPAEDSYSVFAPKCGAGHICECKGFLFAGKCKHVAAVAALIENGWL